MPVVGDPGEGPTYVSRGGIKLAHALDTLSIDVRGMIAADLGCSTGGFTDCLLQRGVARVYSVDTAYGELAWTLRNNPRVVVRERTNALHVPPPTDEQGRPVAIDLVVMDLGWTPQRLAIPAALRLVRPGGSVISLVKPHYELMPQEKGLLRRGVLDEPDAQRIAERTIAAIADSGAAVIAVVKSPIEGGSARGARRGNAEWLVLVRPGVTAA